MELKEFVAETLRQVIEGVMMAQEYAGENGAQVGPAKSHNDSVVVSKSEAIEFDIAVTTNDDVQTKGGAGVFIGAIGMGSQAETGRQNQVINRIKFSIPLHFPRQGR